MGDQGWGPERWRRWRWMVGKQGGVGWQHEVVVLSVGLRPTSLALVGLRPKPRAGAMLDSDMPSDVLACCL